MHIDGSKSSGQTLSQFRGFAPLDLSRRPWAKIDFRDLPCFWWLWHGVPWKFWLQRYACWFAWNIHTKTKRFFVLNFDLVSIWQGIKSTEESFVMLFISYNMSKLEIIWTTKRMDTFCEVVKNRWPMVWMEKHFCPCVQLCVVSSRIQASPTSCQSRFICQT